jgi:L-fuconolactonase
LERGPLKIHAGREERELRRRHLLKLAAVTAAGAVLHKTGLSQSVSSGQNAPQNAPLSNTSQAGPSNADTPETAAASSSTQIPILDAHIHLFDTGRPGGVPWPTPKETVLYKPALPPRYEALTSKHGVVGAIAIEASNLKSDNDWLLKVVKENPVMVGMIGDLVPYDAGYLADLERLHRDPLFLGIRYGNLWDRDLLVDFKKAGFAYGLKALASAGLVFETANPDCRLISAIRLVAERVPDLRIVIDHMPNAKLPEKQSDLDAYWADLHHIAQSPQVFIKLSEIPQRKDDKLVTDPAYYRAGLDQLWDLFGEDRVIFGSDWPNSDPIGSYDETLAIVQSYMGTKSRQAQEKYFWKNSLAAYHWRPRRPNQNLA